MARIFFPLLLLTAVIVFTFADTTKNQFVNWDDQSEITENVHFNPVTLAGLQWNWSNTQLSLYMPITYMVWGGVAEFAHRENGQLQPKAFHVLNLCLHLICIMLVFGLIIQLWKCILPALIGALVFAVHPLQVEPVAWASGMYTLLSTAFSLAAIIAYVAAVSSRPKASLYWLATLFYILALLSKAASVSVPLAAMVIDVLILRRPLRKSFWSLVLWLLLGIPIVLIATHFQDVSVIAVHPIWTRPIVALDATGFYLRKIILPTHLIPDYGRNPNWVILHPMPVMASVATAIAALLLAYSARRNAAWVTAGLGFLLAGVLPYLGLTAFDFQYVSTVADRYAYFGMAGVALLAAGAVARSRWALAGLVIAIAVWVPISRSQVQQWHDTRSLFSHTLKVNPQSLVSHNVFGFLAAQDGDFSKAGTEYKAGLKIWPEDTTIHFNLANLYLRHRAKNAIEQRQLFDDALEHYGLAVKFQPRNVQYRNGLAAALAQSGHSQEAYLQWRQVLAQDPAYTDAHNNLADLLVNVGRLDEAKSEYLAALRTDPKNQHATDRLKQLVKPTTMPQ